MSQLMNQPNKPNQLGQLKDALADVSERLSHLSEQLWRLSAENENSHHDSLLTIAELHKKFDQIIVESNVIKTQLLLKLSPINNHTIPFDVSSMVKNDIL